MPPVVTDRSTSPAAAPASGAAALVSGRILPLLLGFALPNLVALGANALAAVAETSYVGRLGSPALAGMALVFPMVMLQMMFSAGAMGSGVSSAISRALGAGDPARANALAVHAMWIGVAAGVLYMALMLLFGEPLFALLGGRGEALAQAVAYAQVAFAGSIFIWLVNTFSSVIRGSGQMTVPSATLLAISATQVVVGGALGLGWGPWPALGMRGVAAGQLVAFGAGAVYLLWYLRSGRARIRLHVRATPMQRELLRDILQVGAVACLSPLQTVLTILILTRLVAQFGTEALAGYGIGARLEFILVPLSFGIGSALTTLVGIAAGAGQWERARRVAWTGGLMAAALTGSLGIVVALFPGAWAGLFSSDPAVQQAATHYLTRAAPFYAFFGLGMSLNFAAQGANRMKVPLAASLLRTLIAGVGGYLLVTVWHGTLPDLFWLVGLAILLYGSLIGGALALRPWGVR
jgi:putative MATE family efflux protein